MGELHSPERAKADGARLILALSGLPGVGKTTLARALACRLGGIHVSFGDYVRAVAEKLGKPGDRTTLQEIGETLVRDDPNAFVSSILKQAPPGWQTLILDGVRHDQVLKLLREFAQEEGAALRLAHLSIDTPTRIARMAERGIDPASAQLTQNHPSEHDVTKRLAHAANLQLDGNRPVEDLVALVLDSL